MKAGRCVLYLGRPVVGAGGEQRATRVPKHRVHLILVPLHTKNKSSRFKYMEVLVACLS
jgi:hypothetical protein